MKSASCDLEIHHPAPRSLFRLGLKRDRLPERDEAAARVVVTSIVPSRAVQTQCIAVSHPTHLYVTDDYVVTHNTSFALNVAEHVALELRLPVLVFSMEMGGTQLATRLLGSVGKVDAQRLRTGRLEAAAWDPLVLRDGEHGHGGRFGGGDALLGQRRRANQHLRTGVP